MKNYTLVCLYTVIIAMVLATVISYSNTMYCYKNLESVTEKVMQNYTIKNSKDIYDNIKNRSDYTPDIDDSYFISEFTTYGLNITSSTGNEYIVSDNSGQRLYSFTKPVLSYTMSNTLNINCITDVKLRFHVGSLIDTNVNTIPLHLTTSFNEKW